MRARQQAPLLSVLFSRFLVHRTHQRRGSILCRLAAVVRGSPRMIVIVGRTRTREKSVATDLRYGAPLCPKTTVVDGITMISPKRIEDTVRYANITIIEDQ
jgi:hypothetical protein